MNIKPIRNEDDHRDAPYQIETLMNAQENTPEGDQQLRLDLISPPATVAGVRAKVGFRLRLDVPRNLILFKTKLSFVLDYRLAV